MDSLNLFDATSSPVTASQATELWSQLSKRFAENASGKVNAFTAGTSPLKDAASIFYRVELPTLRANPNIKSSITYRGY